MESNGKNQIKKENFGSWSEKFVEIYAIYIKKGCT